MALIICPDCEKKISSKASVCPNCGCPVTVEMRNDLELTFTPNGIELNAPERDALNLVIKAAEMVVQRQNSPEVNMLVNNDSIIIRAVKFHGWVGPALYDTLYIDVVSLSPDRSLISPKYNPDETREEFMRITQHNFTFFLKEISGAP